VLTFSSIWCVRIFFSWSDSGMENALCWICRSVSRTTL